MQIVRSLPICFRKQFTNITYRYARQDLSIRFLSEELGFDSYEDAAQFLINHGTQEFLKQTDEAELVLNSSAFSVFEGAQKSAYQKIDIKGQI